MNNISQLLIPFGILATVGAAVTSSPTLSQYGETIGVVSLLLYFLWEKSKEYKQLKRENEKLIEKLLDKLTRKGSPGEQDNQPNQTNGNEQENSH